MPSPGRFKGGALGAGAQANGNNSGIAGVAGRNFKMVAGVLRNFNDGQGWRLITDPETPKHSSLNVASVSSDGSVITVNFPGIAATKVISFIAAPDETLAAAGFSCGASVTESAAAITLKKQKNVSDYVSYDGANWGSTNNVFTNGGFAAGILLLTHPAVRVDNLGHVCNLTGRAGAFVPQVGGSVNATETRISFYDWAGAIQTVANAGMKVFVDRGLADVTESPAGVHVGIYPSSNIWFQGVFEV
jgi:hypothetical protein